ncbi:hypothetical protein MD484_g1028, partial [Candolleomyces efflorescens]
MARTTSSTPRRFLLGLGLVSVPSEFGMPYEDVELKTPDNVLLRCYALVQRKGLETTHQDAMFVDDDYITEDEIVYGQSIGGAVSIDLASKNPDKISALILENTFTSLPSLVPHALPVLGPVSFLCHQKWDSINKIPLIPATTPILMLSGMEDEIVPKEHMRALWEAVARRGEKASASGSRSAGSSSSSSASVGPTDDSERRWKKRTERAKYMEFEHGGHNDTCVQPGYWAAIIEFVNSLGEMKGVKHAADRKREKTKSPQRAPADSARNPYSSNAARRHMAIGDEAPSPF